MPADRANALPKPRHQKRWSGLPEEKRARLREEVIKAKQEGRDISGRALARLVGVDPETATRHKRIVMEDLRQPLVPGKASDRTLLETFTEAAHNFGSLALNISRVQLAKMQDGVQLDTSLVQILTAAGITLDKVATMRKEDQAAIWSMVLKADDAAALDRILGELQREYARLTASPMGA